TQAPSFELLEPKTGETISLSSYEGKPVAVAFICNHCPYVKHIAEKMAEVAARFQANGGIFIAINSNDVANYSDDSPEKMVEMVAEYGFEFPYLYDESQHVAHAYQAACTPDLYLFDSAHSLYYRGQFDASRPHNEEPVTGADLEGAMIRLMTGKSAPEQQVASLGCNIKWKEGNEPDYFG
ncbi:MAG: thioredoxin family protein, partial [Gammaproteobacteria bacterium]|nr:thioredoxin family protein [Gammaproteobacteria bacterium]